jgi:branched-chain amino acid transport system ATP-binding protein
MALLEIRRLTKNFGGLRAINELDLDVREGEILGLIGPNGAGKTTLFNVISGFFRPSSGEVIFKGENITGLKPHIIARKGIVRTFQLMTLWPDFTIMDTMRTALHMKSGFSPIGALFNTPSNKKKEKQVDERAIEVLRFLGMDHLKNQVARTLSHGYQRTLSLGISVATSPPLLLLDEPVTALNPERMHNILDLVKQVRHAGSTVMLIEHNMTAIFNVCDRIVAINYGNKIAEGTPDEIKDDPVVVSAYLGVKKGVT